MWFGIALSEALIGVQYLGVYVHRIETDPSQHRLDAFWAFPITESALRACETSIWLCELQIIGHRSETYSLAEANASSKVRRKSPIGIQKFRWNSNPDISFQLETRQFWSLMACFQTPRNLVDASSWNSASMEKIWLVCMEQMAYY